MEKVEYSDIVFLDKMNEIKATIKNSGFRIDYHKAYDIDRKMKKVVDELYDPEYSDKYLVRLYDKLDKKIERSKTGTLLLYYFALYQDNMHLLKRMLTEDIGLVDDNDRFNFELLDHEFTKYFTEDQYIYLVQYCKDELLSFYGKVFAHVPVIHNPEYRKKLLKDIRSASLTLFSGDSQLSDEEREKTEEALKMASDELKGFFRYKYSDEERDRYCRNFAEIMTKDPFICKKDKDDPFAEAYYSSLITPETLDEIGTSRLLQLNDVQKQLVSDNSNYCNVLQRLSGILDKYPNYSNPLRLSDSLLSVLADDQLQNFPQEDIPLFEKADSEGIGIRFEHVLRHNPVLRKYPGFIKRDIFESLSDKEMIDLSEEAIRKINHLVVNIKIYNKDAAYRLKRSSQRIAKRDQVLQKVKNLVS